jgi:hypothetical protein
MRQDRYTKATFALVYDQLKSAWGTYVAKIRCSLATEVGERPTHDKFNYFFKHWYVLQYDSKHLFVNVNSLLCFRRLLSGGAELGLLFL